MNKVLSLIKKEEIRQKETLMMIPSENYSYSEVRVALGSFLTHKYSEGYPYKRYYQGNKYVDKIEDCAIESAKKLFKVPYANVQAYSGSMANTAVYMALLSPFDKIMGLSLSSGGHLTHGHPNITFSGKFFTSIQYGVDQNGYIDYDKLRRLANKEKPKLIIAGLTAYPRNLNWKKFSEIAADVNAYLLADISHISGLIAGDVIESPKDYAHVITTTTHKSLRGPRGALIMATQKGFDFDPEIGKKIDRAVFPGLQGGPHDNTIAGIAIALEKALSSDFKKYARQILSNSKYLASKLIEKKFNLVTRGTDNHLVLVDVRNFGLSGKSAAIMLEEANIVVNYNSIPFDPGSAFNPSGIRMGTPALTAIKMKEKEMELIANFIFDVLTKKDKKTIKSTKEKVLKLMKKFGKNIK